MKSLEITQILVYYDLPELFLGKDKVGTKYICLLLDFIESKPFYISCSISSTRVSSFISGKIELREIFVEPEIPHWYTVKEIDKENVLIDDYSFGENNSIPDKYLPNEGYFLPQQVINDDITKEVVDLDNAIIHIALSDNNNHNSIGIDSLGDTLRIYQQLVHYSYIKTLKERKIKDRKEFITPQNYELRAFASSSSSFNIHLFSQSNRDLFGNCSIEFALSKIDEIMSDFDDENQFIEILRTVKGHTINSYKRFLRKVIDEKLTIKYKWFAPKLEFVHHRILTTNYAQKVYDLLNRSEELAEETKEFIGFIKQADVEKGNWRILNEADSKEYNGESLTGKILDGITLETVKYKLFCQEIIEELTVSEKEKIKYFLKSIEKVK